MPVSDLSSISAALKKVYSKEAVEATIMANTAVIRSWMHAGRSPQKGDDLATAVMQRDAMIAQLRAVLKSITEVKGDNRGQQCKRIAEKALKGKKIW